MSAFCYSVRRVAVRWMVAQWTGVLCRVVVVLWRCLGPIMPRSCAAGYSQVELDWFTQDQSFHVPHSRGDVDRAGGPRKRSKRACVRLARDGNPRGAGAARSLLYASGVSRESPPSVSPAGHLVAPWGTEARLVCTTIS